jgi:geranylgeranyl diphosphate synthase type 3
VFLEQQQVPECLLNTIYNVLRKGPESLLGVHMSQSAASSNSNLGALLEPFEYLKQIPGKDVRGLLIDCFQQWLQAPEEKIAMIKDIVDSLHNASLLVDDIEDGSKMRRGVPVAHAICE